MHDTAQMQINGSEAINRSNLHNAVAQREMQPDVAGREPRAIRVLIIDDDSDTAECTARLVELWGHDARRANSAKAGLAEALAFRPDFLLVDIAMPNMDGCELARQVRANTQLRGCFIVAITGYGDDKQRRRCIEAGFDLFLVKPVNLEVLESLLEVEGKHCNTAV